MNTEQKSMAEITLKAVILGVLLSMILAAANAYLGLFAGMTVSASIPAAVVSMGIFRLFKKSNILENNIVQTAASAGESLAAGAIFTLPALLILGFWTEFDFIQITLMCGFGGILGVLFTIPLRRSLIIQQKLKFPEGIATAEVLETGQQGGKGVMHILSAALAGGFFKLGSSCLGLWPGVIESAGRVGKTIVYGGTNLSPALISVGYIVGLNISVLVLFGGGFNWFVAIPATCTQHEWPTYQLVSEAENPDAWNTFALSYKTTEENFTAEEIQGVEIHNADVSEKLGQSVSAKDWAYAIWSAKTRYIGVGAMVIGGLWTIIQLRKSLLGGITSGLKAYQKSKGNAADIPRTEKDIPMKWVMLCFLFSIVPLFILYQIYVKQISISLTMALCMLVTGFVFSAVAGYMAGLVGSSNNPISGVTIATVLTSALLLALLMGRSAENGPAAAIIIGSVVCCAAAIAGDNMQDLKAGHIVGATPWKQQVMQLIGTISAAVVLGPVMMLLNNAYGFAGMEGAGEEALAAPQANLIASVARGVFAGDLPWNFIFIGFVVAVGIIVGDEILRRKEINFRMPILAVAIGIYLPFELSAPIFIGGIIHYVVQKKKKQSANEENSNGLLFASGLITGEALMGILLAIPIVALKPLGIEFPLFDMPFGALLGIGLLIGIVIWMTKVAVKGNE